MDAAGVDVSDGIGQVADAGVVTFVVTAIERDGLLSGPDLELYDRLVTMGRGSIVASGGVRSVDDLRAIRDRGCTGAIVGRAIYEGGVALSEALAVAR